MSSPRAVTIDTPERLRVAPAEPAAPGSGEALVRIEGSGIYGSDREVLAGTRPEGFVRYPVVPGHEWSGTVADVGAGVDPDPTGKPVVGEGFRSSRWVFGAPARAWSHVVRAFAWGILGPSLIITDEFVLDDAADAMQLLARKAPSRVKVLLRP